MSRNNRIYSDTALESVETIIKQNFTKSFVDHSYGEGNSVLKLLGEFTNPKREQGIIYADLTVFRSSPAYDILFDIATNHPHSAGFSLSARGQFSEKLDSQGREIVTKVLRINSIDFVAEPATVNGVFENELKSWPASSSQKSGYRFAPITKESFWASLNDLL